MPYFLIQVFILQMCEVLLLIMMALTTANMLINCCKRKKNKRSLIVRHSQIDNENNNKSVEEIEVSESSISKFSETTNSSLNKNISFIKCFKRSYMNITNEENIANINNKFTYFGTKTPNTNKPEDTNNYSEPLSATHESGHVLCAWFLPNALKVSKTTIIKEGAQGGRTDFTSSVDCGNNLQIDDYITILLGGYAAEKLRNGNITTGSGTDISVATEWALKQIVNFGMDDDIGPIDLTEFKYLLSGEIYKLVKTKISSSLSKAMALIESKKDLLEKLENAILKYKELNHQQIKEILGPTTNEENN